MADASSRPLPPPTPPQRAAAGRRRSTGCVHRRRLLVLRRTGAYPSPLPPPSGDGGYNDNAVETQEELRDKECAGEAQLAFPRSAAAGGGGDGGEIDEYDAPPGVLERGVQKAARNLPAVNNYGAIGPPLDA
jgi:hypothetical protein